MMEGPWCRVRREARARERHQHCSIGQALIDLCLNSDLTLFNVLDCASMVPCPEPEGGHEAARVHHISRLCCGFAAARGTGAAGSDAGDRVPPEQFARGVGAHDGSLSYWTKRNWLCRGPER